MTTEEEIEQLKAEIKQIRLDSQMLGRIAVCTEDFSESDEDTTLICALRLLARYHSMEADRLFDVIRDEKKRN